MTNVLSKGTKVVVALLLVAAMVFSMGISVFAVSPGEHEAALYKAGQYDPDDTGANLSMGDPAILGADVDGTEVTVYVKSMTFMGLPGNVTAMELDGVTGVAGSNQFTFEFDDDVELDAVMDATISVNVNHSAHDFPVSATLVIFE